MIPAIGGILASGIPAADAANDRAETRFFEKRIRPILAEHCYECHSEEAGERKGGLLLDRERGWLDGGNTGKAVVPGDLQGSLLITAVRYQDEDLQMPPKDELEDKDVRLLEQWVRRGAPGPAVELAETSFSRLGNQEYLFSEARDHWAFQPVRAPDLPAADDPAWNRHAVDRFVAAKQKENGLTASPPAHPRTLLRRLSYDLTGLPPQPGDVEVFESAYRNDRDAAVRRAVDRLLDDPGFGEHFGRLWLDVARYADTDSVYRADTKTPHYYPFAFTYRDYVIRSFNEDKPFDQFIREQLAADLLELEPDAREQAALGFLTVGPHRNRSQHDQIDDLIDVTTRGLMGLTAACARCHDHKFEPVPTADYYSLYGVFASIDKPHPLAEQKLPELASYEPGRAERAEYEKKRKAVEREIEKAGDKKVGGNNRSVAKKIRETELAELLLFHEGAPARAMTVSESKRPSSPRIFLRGQPRNRGDRVPRRFLEILDPEQTEYPADQSGRLQLANQIVSRDNPLTARVFVNRVWGSLFGSYLVDTPSDFGLQGADPSHRELLDWLAADFMANGWSLKHLVRTLVSSQTYRQDSRDRPDMAAIDPENEFFWRANRKRLRVEEIRDSLLAASGRLERRAGGHPAPLWGEEATSRRTIYGYINRFNLDPTLRTFDFPSPMQTQGSRTETIVAPQALFGMNSPFVIEQAEHLVDAPAFGQCQDDPARIEWLFRRVYQREPHPVEVRRITKVVEQQKKFLKRVGDSEPSPWKLVAQSLLTSNEFLYVD